MSGPNISTSETKAEALTLQSSAYGVTIPVVGGVTKVAGNLLDYQDFKAVAHTETDSGGKGGGSYTNTTYTYLVSPALAICHGRVQIARVWRGKEAFSGGPNGMNVLRATGTWTPPASGAATLTLANGARRIGQLLLMTDGAPLSDGVDYTVSGSTLTLRNDAFRGKPLVWAHQYSNIAFSNEGLNTIGLSLKDGDDGQTPMSWMQAAHPERALNYPGLSYINGQDYDLGRLTSVDNHVVEVVGFGAYRYNSVNPDCNLAEFASYILANGDYGAAIPAGRIDCTKWVEYCAASGLLMSPALTTQTRAGDFLRRACELTNSQPITSYDRIKVIPLGDVPVTENGVTYTPNTTPLYDLTDDCWLDDAPLMWSRKEPADRYNHVRVEFKDRGNFYNTTILDVQDDAEVALYGKRTAPTISAHWVCNSEVARKVGQLALQRFLAVNGKGRCRLPWAYCLLEPGDLVTITDPRLQFDHFPVRITKVSRDADRRMTIEMEEWPIGTATATAYQTEVPGGYQHNYYVSPGPADAPTIFEGPAHLAGTTGLEVWVAVRGLGANWGGAEVHVSLDGTEYRQIGTVWGGSRYGQLNGAVVATDATMKVDGIAYGALINASATDAQNLQTLCYVGGPSCEFMAYQTATLTGAGAYTLSGLVSAAYGSPSSAHPDNAPFVRMDDAVARSGPLDLTLIGQTIKVKILSFNIYGRATQTLADVAAINYTITGQAASYLPGISGKGVTLAATSTVFKYPKVGDAAPATITLTALKKGALEGEVSFAVVGGSATLTGAGDTRTLAASDMATDMATIRASVTDGVGTYYSDVTIARVFDGVDGSNGSITWSTRGVTQDGSAFYKPAGGTAGWDADAFTDQPMPGGAYIAFSPAQTNAPIMVGLNTDPGTDSSYSSLDFAFYLMNNGTLAIYESQANRGAFGTYETTDKFMVRYMDSGSGGQVDYLKNGVSIRTVSIASKLAMYGDSSFYSPGARLENVWFGSVGAAGPQGPQGLPGVAGQYKSHIFKRSATPPATPTGNGIPAGWYDGPPSGTDPLYMSTGNFTGGGALIGAWATPQRIDGQPGADGTSVNAEYSVDGVSAWHVTPVAADKFMRTRQGSGAWGPAFRIVGEKGDPGADGTSAQFYTLVSTPAQAFTFNSSNVPLPASQTITFDTKLQNIAGTPVYACTLYNASGVSLGPVTLGGSGNSRTLTVAQFGAAQYAVITSTLSSWTDTVKVVRMRDGQFNIAVDLSNDSHTIPASPTGVVLTYSGASTSVVVSEGLTNATASWTITATAGPGVTFTNSGATYTVTNMADGTDISWIDFVASKAGMPTQPAVRFTICKAKAGTIPLRAAGNCTIDGNIVTFPSGTWGNGSAYTIERIVGGAFAQASPVTATSHIMFGLNQDPTTDLTYTSIDYAMYCANGTLYANVSGTNVQNLGPYAAFDALGVTYDGAKVTWSRNGKILRTQTAAPALSFAFDSAANNYGQLRDVLFGALNPLTGIGTNQLMTYAATAVAQIFEPGPVTKTWFYSPYAGIPSWVSGLEAVVITPDATASPTEKLTLIFTATFDVIDGANAFYEVRSSGLDESSGLIGTLPFDGQLYATRVMEVIDPTIQRTIYLGVRAHGSQPPPFKYQAATTRVEVIKR